MSVDLIASAPVHLDPHLDLVPINVPVPVPEPNAANEALFTAVETGHRAGIAEAISNGASCNIVSARSGNTPLYSCSAAGLLKVSKPHGGAAIVVKRFSCLNPSSSVLSFSSSLVLSFSRLSLFSLGLSFSRFLVLSRSLLCSVV